MPGRRSAGSAAKSGRTRRVAGSPAGAASREPEAAAPYHHGDLRAALLAAAERIIARDGIAGLTLRAAAREAGVSHAAPKNHFGDLKGLLSDLAAVGFDRLRLVLLAGRHDTDPPRTQLAAAGRGYVMFARQNPGLFALMFRSERLDFTRPALRAASDAAFAVLTGSAAQQAAPLTRIDVVRIARAWSLVHGYAVLMLDGRLGPLLGRTRDAIDEVTLLDAMLNPAGA